MDALRAVLKPLVDMPIKNDPVMAAMGWKENQGVRGWDYLAYTAPAFCLALFVAVHAVRFLLASFSTWRVKPGVGLTPAEAHKQIAFCTVGIVLHLYLGPAAIVGVLRSEDMPWAVQVGNRDAIAAAPQGQRDVLNTQAILGEMFTGYAAYITIMWSLGWEKGFDKLVHHIAFLCLAVLLAGTYSFHVLSSYAISMELSTPFLNLSIVSGWLEGHNRLAMLFGLLFIVTFIGVRIFFFGSGLYAALTQYATGGWVVVPLPAAVAHGVVALYCGGWLLQVYWLRPIFAKIAEVAGGKKAPKHD
ncbi:hypothetical protein DIPPA_23236 [Diplonema papillatum]|nr:hypothetical protein DIPPA_23236 [Diplonema papillatum]